MVVINKCNDYDILLRELSKEQLQLLDSILTHYESCLDECDTNDFDYVEDYISIYGNGYVIYWYNGIISTKELLIYIKENNTLFEIKEEL